MNFTITGSLGNISKPLTELLVRHGHVVTVVSSDAAKKSAITALGALAAIGSIGDADFLARAFAGADAVYAMIPMSFTETDQAGYMRRMAAAYVEAVRQAGVKRVVVLSGWAADLLNEGSAEQAFDALTDVAVSILRPASFYSNFYMSMGLIRGTGWIGKFLTLRYSGLGALLMGKTGLLMGNFGGDDRTVFVSPKDIAAAAAEELVGSGDRRLVDSTDRGLVDSTAAASVTSGERKKIRYVGSEEMTCNEAARIIGTAVGKPWLKWVCISDKAMLRGLKMAKMPEKLAESLVEMQAAMHKGTPLANFHNNNPMMGKVKLTEFAKEFAAVYHAQKP